MGNSQYFGGKSPDRQHLVRGAGGLAGEIKDLRDDIDESFEAMETNGLLRVDYFVNPPAADADYFLAAQATSTAEQRLQADDLLQTTLTGGPRAISITRTADVGSYTTDDIIVYGKAYGEKVALTFTPLDADGGDTIPSNEDLCLDTIDEVVIPAQVDADGAFDIGFTAVLGLYRPIADMAGIATPLREVAVGVVVTTGAFSGRKYTSAAAPDGARDFAVAYVANYAG